MSAQRAYVGLGANLGDPHAALESALRALAELPRSTLAACSSYYRTAPVDSSGPDYLNAVAALDTQLDAPALLAALQAIETRHGRERPYHNAPRTLDLDLLLLGDQVLHSPTLTLPHPRAHERAFVLVPLVELAPDLHIPGQGRCANLLERLSNQAIQRLPFSGRS